MSKTDDTITLEQLTTNYFAMKEKYISEHGLAFKRIYDLNLDLLGLTPDDKRKDLIDGLEDYTFLTMQGGEYELLGERLLAMICDKYPTLAIKINRNYKELVEKPKKRRARKKKTDEVDA